MPRSEQESVLLCNQPVAPPVPLMLVATHQGITPRTVESLRVLGCGRAAQARLVRITLDSHRQFLGVEKVFRPGLLTRIIYRGAFQAPFAYKCNRHAILAAFYRRRVAGAIVDAAGIRARIAEPLYVRWDLEAEAFVLGSEFIDGRGILPQPTDPYVLRRRFARWTGRTEKYPVAPPEEIAELLEIMGELEHLFRECGLEGSGWQVCKRALVSTANLLRGTSGYVVVDLESGIPAVLVPSYLLGGLRLGSLPPFDDLDAGRLRLWLQARHERLLANLDPERHELLLSDAERLIEHTEAWKRSEPAWGRNKWRVMGRACREQFKAQTIERWRRRGIVDEVTETRISAGPRIYSRLTFLLGLVPGAMGRFLQRLWANRPYRSTVVKFLTDSEFRCQAVGNYVQRRVEGWRESGRIPRAHGFSGITFRFLINGLLAQTTPAGVHRWFSDSAHRRNVLVRMWLVCVSSRFQSEYGRYLIRTWIRQWEDARRITPREALELRRQLDASGVEEYVRCFGMHMGMKLLLPLLTPLKLGGGAAFLASGNLWFLLFLFLMPACRTAVTVWRMLCGNRPAGDYLDALLVGLIPTLGTLAYPVQMYSSYKELSTFLLRDSAARLGRCVPVYGGRDSRTEILSIKLSNHVIECLEIGLAATARLRKKLASSVVSVHHEPGIISISAGRWNRLADEQLRLLAQNEAANRSLHELVSEYANTLNNGGEQDMAA